MNIVNLTPHVINVYGSDNNLIKSFAPDGTVARVETVTQKVDEIDFIPFFHSRFGKVVGLPQPVDGVSFVVSAMVRLAVSNRRDVFSPGALIRNELGQPIGCLGFEANY